MKKPLLVKLEREHIALLRAYRAHHHQAVNDLVGRAVERYLAILYNCEPWQLPTQAYKNDNYKYLPEY